ncbi:BatA domain-containing protein [Lutimonas zeaxanthinifaciens]|uniref:BatA domain-containing protein n=1 Tax=Lutimonas zeaxanthinifaciens TaxID=3060215 RepID=UPI00265D23BF|nr:BatA domain-containing protein [Lutimonas sp. YSD2104]WKK64836.1 BatA domain-containing protein [Lutimonas sp. YSD2104]
MQFKHPEILYFLLLLLIPLLIHLFQLQKFRKEYFTNVKFLKQIELETRKSSKLKKLLILISRMIVLAMFVLAFAQPYFNRNANRLDRQTLLYLDNSLSLQAKRGSDMEAFQMSKNQLIDRIASFGENIFLLTNDKTYEELSPKELEKTLIQLPLHPIKKDLNQILNQINFHIAHNKNTLYEIYLITDFQQINGIPDSSLIDRNQQYYFVDLSGTGRKNIAVDSAWVTPVSSDQIMIKSRIKSWQTPTINLAVSLHLGEELFGKANVEIEENSIIEVEFLIPENKIKSGKISINDHHINFDNELYFVIPEKSKTKVMLIGKSAPFINRIYNSKEFELIKRNISDLDQSKILDQDLIILNELETISRPLVQSLENFARTKGNVVIIPSHDIDLVAYNSLFESLGMGKIVEAFENQKVLNQINYDHPFFKNVFEERVYNFQYPILEKGYITNLEGASTLLEFSDFNDFASEFSYFDQKIYWLSSPLSSNNNSFINSPLVVPLFYNFSIRKGDFKSLYYTIGKANEFAVEANYSDDVILKMIREENEFIPIQLKSVEMTRITTEEYPLTQGIYSLMKENTELKKIAYNYDRMESDMNFYDTGEFVSNHNNIELYDGFNQALEDRIEKDNNKNLWQLFIIFALVFLCLEILLQKFLKN